MKALAPSSNPYSWLPFPGTKCAPPQVDTHAITHGLPCVIQPCASGDYNKEGYQDGKLRGVIGDVGEGEGDESLYNCLSVDGSSVGSILRVKFGVAADTYQTSSQLSDAPEEEDTPRDEGMALSERVQLYGMLGLHSN